MITRNRLIKTCGLVICFFGLCGCGQIETIAKRQIQKEADIQSSEEYVKYESIKQNEDYSDFLNDYDVNEDTGEVVKKDNNPSIIDDGKIKVSFADNNHLKVSYFLDKERKNPISNKYIYLNPGDTLYYSDPEIIHAYTSEFEFNGFAIKKYDNDTVSSETIQQSADGLLYKIPEDFSGDRLTILPIGHYNLRTLNLSANYKDENGSHELSGGKWSINNAIYTGDSASIESAVPFTVKYDYSTYLNDYYVESTSPEAFGVDSQLGIVEFKQSSPIDSNRDYSVTMHRLIDVELINKYYDGDIRDVTKADNVISFLSINDEELSIEKKHELHITLPELKVNISLDSSSFKKVAEYQNGNAGTTEIGKDVFNKMREQLEKSLNEKFENDAELMSVAKNNAIEQVRELASTIVPDLKIKVRIQDEDWR